MASAASAAKVSLNDADNAHVNNIALKEIDAKGSVFAGNFTGDIDASVSNVTVHNNHEDIVQLYKESTSGKLSSDWCTIEGWVTNLPGSHRMASGTFRGRACMFKMLNGSDDDMMLKESELMRKLSRSCINICPCFGVVEFPSDYKKPAELAGKRFSVFEKQPYTLDMVLKSPKINNIIRFVLTTGLLRALAFMSQSHPPVVHGDLATPQVLVNKGYQAVLIDLNASIELKTMMTKTAASASKLGLYQWKAPELFKGKSKTRESDVYAFGLLLFTIWRCDAVSSASGEIEQPWGELDISEVAELVKSGSRPATLEELIEDHEIPHIISNIIVSAWAQKPADRLAGAGIAGIRNLFDTHGEAVLELPEDEYPGWLKFCSPPSSPSSSPPSSPTKTDKYSYVDGIEGIDDDCKSILKKSKMTLEEFLETPRQDFLDIGVALSDARKVVKWIEWKKQQNTEFTEAQQALEKEESAARVVIEEEETSTEQTLQLDHVKTSVVTICGDFKNVAEKLDKIEPECKEAVTKKEAACKTLEEVKKTLEEIKKAYENAKQEAEVTVTKEKELSQLMQKLVAEKETVSKQVGEVENVALSLMSKEELLKLKSEKNVVYVSKAEREAKEEAERKAKEEAEKKAKEEAERKAKEEEKRKAVVFKIDETTPHDGLTVGPGNLLTKVSESPAWVTVRTTLPFSSSRRSFAIRVLECNTRGNSIRLVIGLLPHLQSTEKMMGSDILASSYSSGSGLGVDRFGKCHGDNVTWKPGTSVTFGNNDVVELKVDLDANSISVINKSNALQAVGHFVTPPKSYEELFPAVSMSNAGLKVELLEEYPEPEEDFI